MKQLSIRDVIGPIMVGPSSSHTAGALRISQMTRNLLTAKPASVKFTLYGSFARTYRGHGTDRALVAGILGLHTDDLRIKNSFELAKKEGVAFEFKPDFETKTEHPNTVDVEVTNANGAKLVARGVSIGGGAAEIRKIDGVDVRLTGEFNYILVQNFDEPGVLAHITKTLGDAGINIGTASMYRDRVGGNAFLAMAIDDKITDDIKASIAANHAVKSVRVIPKDGLNRRPEGIGATKMTPDQARKFLEYLDFESGAALLAYCDENQVSISTASILREEAIMATQDLTLEVTKQYLDRVLEVMRESCAHPIKNPQKSLGGLIGGEASAIAETAKCNDGIASGALLSSISSLTSKAMAVLETNASMGRIVAAPTAGSAGVIPAVLLSLQEELEIDEHTMRKALMNAAIVGTLITKNATVAGAEGGCQAEIGSASAMAASAAAELLGATPAQCLDAASNAIANLLGLVCDPVCGLVEIPCQKRNATAAANAIVSAIQAASGTKNAIPFDETVDAMYKVGKSMPEALRETALGGMAACPSCAKFKIGN